MIGKTISHYNILEKLGEGGMGVIYKAQDIKLKRTVALKFLPQELTRDAAAKERFMHEAQAASALDHPNICNIHEIDETKDGNLFIVMNYYDGETLQEKIERGPLKVTEAIDMASQITQGLTKAHEEGIVHRDIKPANILVTKDSVVKVLDFGLAKLGGQTKVTREGTTLGTASYMSPEQATGEDVDHRSDIWSVGVVLYEMLTGQVPFKGEYGQAVIYSIKNDEPEPITGLRTGIPMELERIINKCLGKKSSERYQHLDEMIVDLRKLERDSESKILTTTKGISKERKKSYRLSAILFSAIITVIAGYFLVNQFILEERPESKLTGDVHWENSIAVLPFVDLSPNKDQEYFCDGMTEQIITNLSKIKRLKVIGRTSVMSYKNTEKKLPEIGEELNVAYILEGSIRKYGNSIRVTSQLINTKDGSHLWADDFDRELEHVFKVQDDVSESIATKLFATLSHREKVEIKTNRPNNVEAWECYMMGRNFHHNKYFTATWNTDYFYKSEEKFLKAIEIDSNYALSYAGLADLYHTHYRYGSLTEEERNKYLELVEINMERAYRLNSSSSYVNRVMGSLTKEKGNLLSAFKFYKKAVELDENEYDSNYELGWFFYFRGLYQHALKYFNKAIVIDPLNPQAYNSRSNLYWNLGQFKKSELDFKKALDINPNHHNALSQYSRLLIYLRKYDEAKKMMAKYKELYPEYGGNTYLTSLMFAIKGEKEKALEPYPRGNLILYIYLGMGEEIITYLNENYNYRMEQESPQYLWLKNSPIFDFIRADPRFQEILAKHKKLYEENLRKYGDIEI